VAQHFSDAVLLEERWAETDACNQQVVGFFHDTVPKTISTVMFMSKKHYS